MSVKMMVMPAPAVRRATYQDVLDAPPNMIAEVILGTLHTQPRPAIPHAIVSTNLGALMTSRFRFGGDGPGEWVILDEPELHLGAEPDILVPDLAAWRRERLDASALKAPWIATAPDWICEVLSPSTQAIDRAEKMAIYLRERVSHVWLIDPLERLVEIYRHNGASWLRAAVHHGDETVRAEPFESVEMQLSWLWTP